MIHNTNQTANDRQHEITRIRNEIQAIDEIAAERPALIQRLQLLTSDDDDATRKQPSVADQVVELLTQVRRPMHHTEIYRALKHFVRATGKQPSLSLACRYRNDPRLQRTAAGTYGLRAWCHAKQLNGSDADKVVALLRQHGQPLHFRLIYQRLAQQVVAGGIDPANSLLARYSTDPRLYRTAPGVYALIEWRRKAA